MEVKKDRDAADFRLQQAKEVLGYLGPGAKQTSEFMRPLPIDLITVMESEELYPSPSSTFPAHAMEMRHGLIRARNGAEVLNAAVAAGLPLNLPVHSRACDAEDVQRLVAHMRLTLPRRVLERSRQRNGKASGGVHLGKCSARAVLQLHTASPGQLLGRMLGMQAQPGARPLRRCGRSRSKTWLGA